MKYPRPIERSLAALLLAVFTATMTPAAWADSGWKRTRKKGPFHSNPTRSVGLAELKRKTVPGVGLSIHREKSLASTLADILERVMTGREIDDSIQLSSTTLAELNELTSQIEIELENTRDVDERMEYLANLLDTSGLLDDMFSELDMHALYGDMAGLGMDLDRAIEEALSAMQDFFNAAAVCGLGPVGVALLGAAAGAGMTILYTEYKESQESEKHKVGGKGQDDDFDGDGDPNWSDPDRDGDGVPNDDDEEPWEQDDCFPPVILDWIGDLFEKFELLNGRSAALDLALATTQPRHIEVGTPGVIHRGLGRYGTGSINRELGPVVREIDPRVSSVIDGKVSRISPRVISRSSVIDRRSGTITLESLRNRSRSIRTPRFVR